MAKYAAKGAILKVTITATPTVIPGLGDIELDLGETEEIDVTSHDSPGDTREYANGFKNPSDITVPIIYDPADNVHEYLRAAHGGSAEAFELTLPDAGAATYSFSGIVKGFTVGLPVDGRMDATVTIKPTGAITFAA